MRLRHTRTTTPDELPPRSDALVNWPGVPTPAPAQSTLLIRVWDPKPRSGALILARGANPGNLSPNPTKMRGPGTGVRGHRSQAPESLCSTPFLGSRPRLVLRDPRQQAWGAPTQLHATAVLTTHDSRITVHASSLLRPSQQPRQPRSTPRPPSGRRTIARGFNQGWATAQGQGALEEATGIIHPCQPGR